jgi:hypothetical protein
VGDESLRLPSVGQTGRLHVAGRSVPVEVLERIGPALKLEVTEEGWSLTAGEARLVCNAEDGTGLIAGTVRVLPDGVLFFTPGKLTREVQADGPQGEETIERRGRGQTPEVGQRRETFRVDLIMDVVVLVDGRELAAQTLNLSPTGCLVRGRQRPLTDALVTVRLPVDEGRRLQLRARVIRVEEDRYALHFVDMDAAQDRALSRLIAKRQREILRRR